MTYRTLKTIRGILNRMDHDALEIAEYAPILEVAGGLSLDRMDYIEEMMMDLRSTIGYLLEQWENEGTLS